MKRLKQIKYFIPLIVFLVLVIFFMWGLYHNPYQLLSGWVSQLTPATDQFSPHQPDAIINGLAGERYPFKTQQQRERFYQLTNSLRCLVCPNESLDASDAGLANDLKREIYSKMQQGQSTVAIKQYMVQRYGDFILFKPRWSAVTVVLWCLPVLFLLLALIMVWLSLRRNGKKDNDLDRKA